MPSALKTPAHTGVEFTVVGLPIRRAQSDAAACEVDEGPGEWGFPPSGNLGGVFSCRPGDLQSDFSSQANIGLPPPSIGPAAPPPSSSNHTINLLIRADTGTE
jgi:hypothetical protein